MAEQTEKPEVLGPNSANEAQQNQIAAVENKSAKPPAGKQKGLSQFWESQVDD